MKPSTWIRIAAIVAGTVVSGLAVATGDVETAKTIAVGFLAFLGSFSHVNDDGDGGTRSGDARTAIVKAASIAGASGVAELVGAFA